MPKIKKTIPALEDFPKSLRMAIAKVMVRFEIDYPEILERAALLLDINSSTFSRAVNNEAERKYKKRFMTQFNKARAKIIRDNEEREKYSYQRGYNKGKSEGKEEFGVWFNCAVCNKIIYIRPDSEVHRIINEHIRQLGAGHSSCIERNK